MRVIPPCRQPEEPQAGQVRPPEACFSPTHSCLCTGQGTGMSPGGSTSCFLGDGNRQPLLLEPRNLFMLKYMISWGKENWKCCQNSGKQDCRCFHLFPPFASHLLVFLLLAKFVNNCLRWGFVHPRLVLNSCNREQPRLFGPHPLGPKGWNFNSGSWCLVLVTVSETGVLLQYPTWPPDPGLKSSFWISLQRSWRFEHVPPWPALALS